VAEKVKTASLGLPCLLRTPLLKNVNQRGGHQIEIRERKRKNSQRGKTAFQRSAQNTLPRIFPPRKNVCMEQQIDKKKKKKKKKQWKWRVANTREKLREKDNVHERAQGVT